MTSAMERDAAMGRGINGSPQPGQQLQQAASGLFDQAARTAEAQASTTMTRAGEALESVARAIRTVSEDLRENQPQIAGFAQTTAEQVDHAATYLRERQAGEALDSLQQMARRQPAVIVGGGLVLGLLVGRLLRSGASEMQGDQGDWRQDPYGSARYGSSRYGTGYARTGYAGTGYAPSVGAYGDPGRPDFETAPTSAPLAADVIDDDTPLVDAVEDAVEPTIPEKTTTRRGAR
jgi:hypothetical protein